MTTDPPMKKPEFFNSPFSGGQLSQKVYGR